MKSADEKCKNSARTNTLIFCGVDTSICVETSMRDGFNQGYDVVLVADATTSRKIRQYDTTVERERDYYGIVTNLHEFEETIKILGQIKRIDRFGLTESMIE